VSGAGATELLGRFPEVAQVAETPVLEFCNVNSPLLSIEQAFELRGALEKLLAADSVMLGAEATEESPQRVRDLLGDGIRDLLDPRTA
jgi:hypothetical protein